MIEKSDINRGRYLARLRQRKRRQGKPRIDYYACQEAKQVIEDLRRPYVGHDASSILNRIVLEWARDRIYRTL